MIRNNLWPCIAVTALAATALFSPLPAVAASPLANAAFNALHLPLFFAVTIAAHAALGSLRPQWRPSHTAACISVLAVASELLQQFVGRTWGLTDLLNNAMGIFLATLALRIRRPTSNKDRVALAASFLLAIAVAAYPAGSWALASHTRNQLFPVLGNFENHRELQFWIAQGESASSCTTVTRSEAFAAEGNSSLKISTTDAPWAGVHHLAAAHDCSGYSHLSFTTFNPGATFTLGIRFDLSVDSQTQRHAHQVSVKPGRSSHRLPLKTNRSGLNRPPQSTNPQTQLKKITFHLGTNPSSTDFFIDFIYLL